MLFQPQVSLMAHSFSANFGFDFQNQIVRIEQNEIMKLCPK